MEDDAQADLTPEQTEKLLQFQVKTCLHLITTLSLFYNKFKVISQL